MSDRARDVIGSIAMLLIVLALLLLLIVGGDAWLPKRQPDFAIAGLAWLAGIGYAGVSAYRHIERWIRRGQPEPPRLHF